MIYVIYVLVRSDNMTKEITTIRVSKELRDKLATHGDYYDSMETILWKLLQAYEEK